MVAAVHLHLYGEGICRAADVARKNGQYRYLQDRISISFIIMPATLLGFAVIINLIVAQSQFIPSQYFRQMTFLTATGMRKLVSFLFKAGNCTTPVVKLIEK